MITLKNTKDMKLEDLPSYKKQLEATLLDHNGVPIAKGGVACPFPWRLHECLDAVEREGLEHVISWKPHGRAFIVYQPAEFERLVLPRFFNQTRYSSFQRQLNIYGFVRFQNGMDRGSYYNLNFVRGERSMVRNLRRTKIKGKKAHSQPEVEPDFYSSEWKKAAPSKVVVEQAPPSIPQVVNAVVSSAPVDNHVVSDDSDSSLSGEDLLSIFSDSFSADETPEEPKMSWGSDFAFVPNNVISSAYVAQSHPFALAQQHQQPKVSIPDDIFAPIPIAEMAPMQMVDATRNLFSI